MSFPHRHTIGINRREMLQVGYTGLLGLGMSSFARAASKDAPSLAGGKKPKSLLIVFLTGAASQLETFDPKPDAPAEIRGEYKHVATKTPGLLACEHIPKLAARSQMYSVVRSLAHRDNNHLCATHHVLTGQVMPGAFFDKIASRDDYPNYAGGLSYFRKPPEGTPVGVNLPTYLMEGPLLWPGQHAGFLGPSHDIMQVRNDPNLADFQVENLRPAAGMDVTQLRDRVELLNAVNGHQKWLADAAETKKLSDQQQQAVAVLTSGKVAKAFDIGQEPVAVRDRYGRHAFGQSCLLARRLIEAGVPVVQANMGRVQNWDNHGDLFKRMKKDLLPPLDSGVSALLDDMSRARAAGRHDGDDAGRVRARAEGEQGRRARALGAVLLGAVRRGGRSRRDGGRPERQDGRLPGDHAVLTRRHRRDGVLGAGHRPARGGDRPPRPPGGSSTAGG